MHIKVGKSQPRSARYIKSHIFRLMDDELLNEEENTLPGDDEVNPVAGSEEDNDLKEPKDDDADLNLDDLDELGMEDKELE